MCMIHPGNSPFDTLPPGGSVTTTHKAAPPPTMQPSIGASMTGTTVAPTSTAPDMGAPPLGQSGPAWASNMLNGYSHGGGR